MPVSIERTDLAAVEADAIVVAANEHLQITGGVGLTVAQAAGLDELQAACDAVGFCPCGSAVATPAFGLRANVVVHAVGPIWLGGNRGEADFLRSAYDAALECAAGEGARSIALPLVSNTIVEPYIVGVFGVLGREQSVNHSGGWGQSQTRCTQWIRAKQGQPQM